MDNNILKRKFWINKQNNYLTDDTIIDYIKNNDKLYVVLADGGMGKTFLAKKWSKELQYKYIKSQEINENDIKDKIIIDNLDEINIIKVKNIIKWVTISGVKNVIIFSRPETFLSNNLFNKIYFQNELNIIPRYKNDFKLKTDCNYSDFEKHFSKSLKINEIEFDFLSVLSFKLLSSGVININKYDLLEFTRKYNINNASSVRIVNLIDKHIFKEYTDGIYFKNKTIPSFFVIGFFKKFAHIKNSYLVRFNNFASQLSFKETSQIIYRMEDDGLKLSWDLINNNNFFFMFLTKYEITAGLDSFFQYGSKMVTKDELTERLAKIQIICSNDEVFNGSIYYNLNSKTLEMIDFKRYIQLIKNGIKDKKKLYTCIFMFLNNFEYHSINDETLYKKNIDFIKNIKITEYMVLLTDFQYTPSLYVLGLVSLNTIPISKYNNYIGPIEDAISYAMNYEHKKALKLMKYFSYQKSFPNNISKDKLNAFIDYLIGIKDICKIMNVLQILNLKSEDNDPIIQRIGMNKIRGYINNMKRPKDVRMGSINISEYLYRDINKLEYANEFYQYFIGETFHVIPINHIKYEDNSIDIDVSKLNSIIMRLLSSLNLEPINIYQKGGSYSLHKGIVNIKIPHNENIENIVSHWYDGLYELLDQRKNNISHLTIITDFILQVIFKLNTELNIDKLHPLILLMSKWVFRNDGYGNRKIKGEWYSNIQTNITDNRIIEYLKNYKTLEYIITRGSGYYIENYMNKIIRSMSIDNIKKILSLLGKSGELDRWYSLLADFYKYPEAKNIISNMKWKPINFDSYINNEKYMKAWNISHEKDIEEMKDKINELFKKEFRILERNRDGIIPYNIMWYDKYLEIGNGSIIRKTTEFLNNNNLINYYYKCLRLFVRELISTTRNTYIIHVYFDWLICLSSIDKNIITADEVNFLYNNFPKLKSEIETIWFNKTNGTT